MKKELLCFTLYAIIIGTLIPAFVVAGASDVPFANVPFDVNNIPEPVPPPKEVRDFFALDPFYQQWISVEGFPVLASANVSPYAVKEAAWQIGQMTEHRSDILKALAQDRIRFSIIAHNEMTSDIPELGKHLRPHFFYNVRNRGGNCPKCKTVFAEEESLVNNHVYSVLIHEMAHSLHAQGLSHIDPTFDSRLKSVYSAATRKGLWQDTYASTNRDEYLAEAVGSWFHAVHFGNPVKTRDALKTYDPALATLIIEVFGDSDWRYTPIRMRTHLTHLQGFNSQLTLQTEWPPGVLETYEELHNPAINERNGWVNLPPIDPSLVSILNESSTRGNRTDILFVNLSGAEILLYWVFPDGTETFARRSPPNDPITQFTAEVGGLMITKDTTGRPLAVFQAVEKTGRAFVAPSLNLITPGLSRRSGDNQTGVSGTALENPFVIEVRTDNLSVVEGISVTFTVIAGGGTLSVTRTTTNEKGRAESTLTLGQNIGTNTVEVSTVGIAQPVIFNAVAESAIVIPDSNLHAAIEQALPKASGATITTADMARLIHLTARNANISNLTGLEAATNLKSLWFDGEEVTPGTWGNSNSVSDLLPLAGLTQLEELDLWVNSVSDISPLAGLTNLTHLGLVGNNISDISVLAGLTNLTGLWVDDNPISDFSPLAGLTQLTRLGLDSTSISDLSPLTGLTSLTWMRAGWNNITDISPLVANTELGSGDEVDIRGNSLSYASIHTHIPALQNRGVTVEFDNRTPTTLLKISGDDQKGIYGETLTHPFVVEVRDGNGDVFEGVPVAFDVTAGGGTFSITSTNTDKNGRAESTFTLGNDVGMNTVSVSAAEIQGTVIFKAVAEGLEFDLSVPMGTSLIHIPLKVTAVDGVAKTVTTISNLYDALGGVLTVNFLMTYDSQQDWLGYWGTLDASTPADRTLTDDIGIIAGMKAPVSLRLSGTALGTNGNSTITLNQGLNLVGIPLRDERINRVSDLLRLDGVWGNVPVIILNDGGKFKVVGRAGDPGDIAIIGGGAFIMNAQHPATVTISGDGWYNTSEAAAPPLSLKGIEVGNTTPVLGLRGSIVDEEMGTNRTGFRVIVKNLSTGRAVAAVTKDKNYSRPDKQKSERVDYQVTIVDVETERAAQIGDTLEISVRAPTPLIGVQPLRYPVTAEDVKHSLIQLPELVAYEIPAETELLANYPNPFNPETWIPYRLAEDAFVTLTIYDGTGHIVRTLEVGHQIASAYENRSKAVYWDGRNGLGEQMASGVYFYHLSAGDYSATRKMVILK